MSWKMFWYNSIGIIVTNEPSEIATGQVDRGNEGDSKIASVFHVEDICIV